MEGSADLNAQKLLDGGMSGQEKVKGLMDSPDYPTNYEGGPLGMQACVALWHYIFR